MTRRALAIDALGNVGESGGASVSQTGLSSPTEPSSTVSALTGFDPSREEMAQEGLSGPSLEATLQIIYDQEINVGITTMWDGGFDLSIGGAPGWTEPLASGCVYGAHNIGPWLRLAVIHFYNEPAASVESGDAQ